MIKLSTILATLLSVAAAAAIPIATEVPGSEIKVTASSTFSPEQNVQHLIDGSGLTGDRHDSDRGARTMWHTTINPVPGSPAPRLPYSPAWVRFDFTTPQTIVAALIWNHNQAGLTDRGFRKTRLYASTDGKSWRFHTIEIPRGTGAMEIVALPSYGPLRSVIIAAESNWGGDVYGLSEVGFAGNRDVAEAEVPFPTELDCVPQPCYRHLPDGSGGREITIHLKGAKLHVKAALTVECEGKSITTEIPPSVTGISDLTALLPAGASVTKECQATITLRSGNRSVAGSVTVPPKRQWTIYLFPHSHVDIGYTNPQDVVEKIHLRNMDVGIELGNATAGYPEGARHVWNNEVGWPVESWLKQATPERKQAFIEAVKKGQIGLSASYLNLNTSVASDEELMRFFAFSRELRRLTGAPIDTMCQFDIPGLSWGIVQAAAQNGVRAILDFPNPSDRIGSIHTWRNRPFYWIAPDGKAKVLYIQCFPYNVAWKLGAFNMNPPPFVDAPGRDRAHFANTPLNGSGEFKFDDFVFSETAKLEQAGSPYDIYPCAWSLSDNAPVDVDLPDYVKKWNETYAYPRLVIASASTIANAFESRFGSTIPQRKGDLTEYWTDGLGSDARRVGFNRPAKETLVQAEILSTMLPESGAVSAADRYAAWRWIQLGTEHTWGYMMPDQPMAKGIEATKASYFEKARDTSQEILAKTLQSVAVADSATIAVFNTLTWPRTGVVTLSAEQSKGALSVEGTSCQRLSTGELVFLAEDVPALGSVVFRIGRTSQTGQTGQTSQTGQTVSATPTALENSLVKVILNPTTGDISSLVDKRTGHDFANAKSPYSLNSFRYLRGGDAPEKATAPTAVKISIKERGPVQASLLIESEAEGCRRLTREVRLIAGQPQVEIFNTVDKIATRAKEGIHFAFAFNLPADATPRMDIPWGVMNPLADQLAGANKNWLACQRWIDVSGADCGITWVPREASIVQFGDITANLLGAVAPGAWKTQLGDPRTIVSWALNNHWHTNFPLEQGGVIPFNYAILPHGAYDPVVANRFGLDQNQPLLALPVARNITVKPIVTLDNPRVFISTLKPADDGKATILRLRSLSDQPETVKLSWPAGPPQTVQYCDATEVPGEPAGSDMAVLPYGIVTLRVQLK
jgi:hypothetical protein